MTTREGRTALPAFLETRESFDGFVRAWEAAKLPKAQWTHAAHVAMGAGYVVRYGTAAVDEMRNGIRRHNAAVGTADTEDSGYHETLTCFWTGVLGRTVAGFSDPWLAARHAAEKFGADRNLHRLYYSFDVVEDRAARAAWVPPDLVGPY
jgi:hypothetical protein